GNRTRRSRHSARSPRSQRGAHLVPADARHPRRSRSAWRKAHPYAAVSRGQTKTTKPTRSVPLRSPLMRRSLSARSESESGTAVAAAVEILLAGGYGVESGRGVGDVAEPVDELVAPLQQLDGFVAGETGCAGGGEVVFGALDSGEGLVVGG